MINIRNSLLWGVSFAGLFLGLQIGFYELVGHEYYFKYHSVEFSKVDDGNNALVFESDVVTRRLVHYEWNDILHCDTGVNGDYVYFSNYESSATVDGMGERKKNPWNYLGRFPRDANCYLRSIAEVQLPYGYYKPQISFSEPFHIPPKN